MNYILGLMTIHINPPIWKNIPCFDVLSFGHELMNVLQYDPGPWIYHQYEYETLYQSCFLEGYRINFHGCCGNCLNKRFTFIPTLQHDLKICTEFPCICRPCQPRDFLVISHPGWRFAVNKKLRWKGQSGIFFKHDLETALKFQIYQLDLQKCFGYHKWP